VVDEVELPDPAPDQVLVKLFASGICHSQLHQIHRNVPRSFPTLLGHESTGVVIAKGAAVSHVREGDHVMTTWIDRGGAADTAPRSRAVGRWNETDVPLASATWTEHALMTERLVVPLDTAAPTDVTSIIGCAVMTGAGAILNTLRVRPGQSVAVFGVGGIGLCAIAAAAVVDAYPIIAVDLSEEKLAFAKRFGATHGVNASEGDPVQQVRELTNGGVDYAIDAIGAVPTQEQILLAARPGLTGSRRGGTALLVGIPQKQGHLDTNELLNGRTYMGTFAGDSLPDRDFLLYVRWHREGKLKLDELVTRRYPLDQINEAVDDLTNGRIAGRSILEF
jgi:Zn-dependent alcohol dehydrogenase